MTASDRLPPSDIPKHYPSQAPAPDEKKTSVPVLCCCFLLHEEHGLPDALPPTRPNDQPTPEPMPYFETDEEKLMDHEMLFPFLCRISCVLPQTTFLIDEHAGLLSWELASVSMETGLF